MDLAKLNLGEKTTYEYSYNPALLETFETPAHFIRYSGELLIVAPEFTSLCPKTGQPDFATIEIKYSPAMLCVESKSLKLYLGSFRNHGAFHEECVATIAHDLIELLAPYKLEVIGKFTPRGGIPFWPTVRWSR
jgi:7-cyano-7-deazaguanine reductase